MLAVPVFFLLMMAGIGMGLIDLGVSVLFGWIKFLADVWPRISWNWGAIWTAFLCLGLALLLSHWFLDWLCRGIASARGKTFSWPWKWTVCGSVGIGLCFLVGMAVAGAVHQIGWIAGSEEPLFQDRYRRSAHYMEIQNACYVIERCLKSTSTVESLRADVATTIEAREGRYSVQEPNLQSLHLLMLVASDAKVEGVLVFPRNVDARSTFGGAYQGQAGRQTIPPNDLMKFIGTNENRLVAF